MTQMQSIFRPVICFLFPEGPAMAAQARRKGSHGRFTYQVRKCSQVRSRERGLHWRDDGRGGHAVHSCLLTPGLSHQHTCTPTFRLPQGCYSTHYLYCSSEFSPSPSNGSYTLVYKYTRGSSILNSLSLTLSP